MEAFHSLIVASIASILLVYAWKALNWAWIKPKKLEKILRKEGYRGKQYRFVFGDLKEIAKMEKEAISKPINFTNEIIPRVLPFMYNIIKDHGKNFYTWMGPKPAVVVMEPEHIKEIFARNYVYQKPPSSPIFKYLAQGLASYDTEKWAKHRRLISPAFHLEKVKLMLPAFYLSCSEMLSNWNTIAPAEGTFELDVWPNIRTLTSDAISRTAFGSNYEEGKRLFALQQELSEYVAEMLQSIYIPGMRFLPTKKNRRMMAIVKEFRVSVLSIVNRRVKAIQGGESSGDDLLGLLLESNLREMKEQGNKKGMSFDEVIEECKLFYFGGHETVASLLVWTLILLSKHLDWQARARDEIRQIFGESKPDYEGLSRLKIMTMILNEVLRLYPPGAQLYRMIHEDATLGNQTLPAGTPIVLPVLLLHHDESIWGADAKEFKPERFNEGILNATKGKHMYFPFAAGPRVCIGQNFAMLEAKMAMALILQSFSFELSPMYVHAPYSMITLQPQHGAQLVLKRL